METRVCVNPIPIINAGPWRISIILASPCHFYSFVRLMLRKIDYTCVNLLPIKLQSGHSYSSCDVCIGQIIICAFIILLRFKIYGLTYM